MTSAWGEAWDAAWGDSWGETDTATVVNNSGSVGVTVFSKYQRQVFRDYLVGGVLEEIFSGGLVNCPLAATGAGAHTIKSAGFAVLISPLDSGLPCILLSNGQPEHTDAAQVDVAQIRELIKLWRRR